MDELGAALRERLQRVLMFLSVSGGAALICKRRCKVVAAEGAMESDVMSILAVQLDSASEVRFVESVGLIADVGRHHRLVVCVPPAAVDASFGERMRRAVALLERFALYPRVPSSPVAPPTSAPAHSFVFPPRVARRA